MAKKKLSHADLVTILKQRQGDKSLRGFAVELGISAPYLHDIYMGRRSPGPAVLDQIGFDRVTKTETYYVRTA